MKKIGKKLPYVLGLVAAAFLGWYLRSDAVVEKFAPVKEIVRPKPLEKYSIPALSASSVPKGNLERLEVIEEEDDFTSYLFSMEFDPDLDGKDLQKTTGMLNIPNEEGEYPVVVMYRGYVDPTLYETGVGTRNAGRYLAARGFITIAPDFLGYAGSDGNAADIFESRFQTYTTALSLVNSLTDEEFSPLVENKWDKEHIFQWAHSNGGQIALTVLEVTSADFPTTLWAPVSTAFPYSVLYYTNESADGGKFIRSELADFEELYDADLYTLTRYLNKIQAPIQLHQGGEDDAVPKEWSDTLYGRLKSLEKEIEYYVYPAADHNLRPNWDTVVERDLKFYTNYLAPEED